MKEILKPYLGKVHKGHCLNIMQELPDNSIDAIITDPPYGISFMNNKWDYDIPGVRIWRECLRVLKPGGHLLSFFGTRTYHRGASSIEDAGFEIRDLIMWLYGSGFPKNLDLSKAIDELYGAEREVVGDKLDLPGYHLNPHKGGEAYGHGLSETTAQTRYKAALITAPATELAKQWEGWGTALKPACEPIVVARKPFVGDVATNVLTYGTGAININGCRIPTDEIRVQGKQERTGVTPFGGVREKGKVYDSGRYPANVIHDGSPEATKGFPETKSGKMKAGTRRAAQDKAGSVCYGVYGGNATERDTPGDNGSAARFFYCAKATKEDRGGDELEGIPLRPFGFSGGANTAVKRGKGKYQEGKDVVGLNKVSKVKNNHPTVKPTKLMRYLVRLVTPPEGVVLDPFAGSGSTGKAAALEGFDFIGVERVLRYVEIANARLAAALAEAEAPKKRTKGGK